ncbi:MAG: methyltransferase domain-containing protein [Verrucomicrobiae bacterium]|nr:methyltransferase domain-containing protein [Verrucomicrobiae bacterium]
MSTTKFNADIGNQVFRDKVAAIYGWSTKTGTLDPRLMYYLQLVDQTGSLTAGKHLVDLGPGLAAFGPVARALGLEVTLIDDFAGGGGVDREQREKAMQIMAALRDQLGIQLLEMDFLQTPLPLADASVDVVTCFHSLEHWHHSPKRLFAEITRVVRPGGFLILATPNAVNLRKRIFALLGKSPVSSLKGWYHDGDPVYRGHVREPVIRDLHQILQWNGFDVISTQGRNYIGGYSIALRFLPSKCVRLIATGANYLLRAFPSLCSDIHVIGQKRR